ncbi:MAG: M24 family metallopeptidase [Gemmatimonadetes bacterium]|uniref:Xaa-Pro aminopeptidase n=1 Tax=Candidatus Kutchimonas denitrificans TaxID=3056748 RepID=A0AAE4Z9D6_9BACT|nr:M24 family metallopeptidase [Gemmatimonadota bacterium]NIR75448.1 M24 family metallopeptidase [Candidatus Kutchimonas denitrificans]NIS01762.1 M24 family metallopeptidase [Gemmatimonadota bacterium]NIT67543.1 M24 family metallopeptidase [Gemmatimonadota bacterium]NIU53417.1 M24 family metallopeptidase [Gemmatimonadota bacterium]
MLRAIPILISLGLALVAFAPNAGGAGVVDARPVYAGAGPDTAAVPARILEQRRAALLALMEPGIAIVRSADPRADWSHPQDARFRQNNDFYYLTGLETPGSWLVLFKRERGPDRELLYLPKRDPAEERWSGSRPGVGDETARRTGVEAVRPAAEFGSDILAPLGAPGSFSDYARLYVPLGGDPSLPRDVVDAAVAGRRSIVDLGVPLAELRVRKDSVELARLRRAVDITVEAHRAALQTVRPGVYEYELEARIEYVFRSMGAHRLGFPSIVGSGPNSVVLHYDRNRRRMEAGELVVVDVGAEYSYYTADITRTYPVSGKFTPRQRKIYELVLATQQTAIDSVRPGITLWRLSQIARSYMREHSDGLCGDLSCDRYFIHGLSHWLGMDVHDVGDYTAPLVPGMVITVEPGIYLPDEELGVRIEDDVLVTEKGHVVLSEGAPKTVAEIESLTKHDACECPAP